MPKKQALVPSVGESIAAGRDLEGDFAQIVGLIRQARQRAHQSVNRELVELYWRVGEYLHQKIDAEGWAQGTVVRLAAYIAQREPGLRGFSPPNLWRMRQFFVAYRDQPELSTLLRELPWSANLMILSLTKRTEEREFYLRSAAQHRWSVRELQRQIDGSLFERAVLDPPSVSTALREMQPEAEGHFKDAYLLEFLGLPAQHTEADLHRSLLQNLGRFLTELGRDSCFVGSQYPLQVGGQDFALDLEALDRDVRKPHENPAIGLLLCATKDNEVVEYALSRTLSPALVAEYRTQLPDKKLLRAKLQEFFALSATPTL